MKKIVKREKMKKELTQKKGKGKQTAAAPAAAPATKQANGNARKPPPKRPVVDAEGMCCN